MSNTASTGSQIEDVLSDLDARADVVAQGDDSA